VGICWWSHKVIRGKITPGSWFSTKQTDTIFYLALNVRAPFFLMQGALQLMIEKRIRGGSIVNIISMPSHGGQLFLTPYSTSKGALVTLTRNVANSAIKDRIGVVAFLLSDESGLISGSIIDFDQNVVRTYS
jgi:short-subunit dehydrogenase